MCKVSGHEDCRFCVFSFEPQGYDGGCMIPYEYRATREKAIDFMKDRLDLLGERQELFKQWIPWQAEQNAKRKPRRRR